MQYQVLARKWRPRNFEQLVGQEHVLKALVNALDQDRLHHAYLFTGTRGVGKTTIARILAKCLNCEKGVSSVPCDACPSCVEINEGRCVDLIEVDAASRTKVEDTRELLDNVQYAPTRCRYKIYLIDEVHMLSNHSFNALLKTLEEPPPHIKFLLATTDPQKLPVTILSRCLQFNLKNMSPDRIVEHLRHVLGEEGVPFDDAALWQLGRAAQGSMRDALSLADQGIAYGQNELRAADVTAMLGTIDRARIYRVVDALCSADAGRVLGEVAELAEFSPDYPALLDELISVLHRMAVVQAVPESLDSTIDARERIEELAARVTAEDLQLYYQIALIGRRDLPLNPEPRAGLEMVLLRMLAFQPTISAPSPPKKKQRSTALTHSQPEAVSAAPGADPASEEGVVENSRAAARQQLAETKKLLADANNTPAGEGKRPALAPQPASEPGQAAPPSKLTEPRPAPTSRNRCEAPREGPATAATRVPGQEPVSASGARSRAKLDLVVDNQPGKRLLEPAPVTPYPATIAESPPEPGTLQPEPARQPASLDGVKCNQDWIGLVQRLPVKGMTRNILGECVLSSCSADCLNLLIAPQYIELLTRNHEDRISHALLETFGRPVNFKVEARDHVEETPAAWQKRIRAEQVGEARRALENDPLVQQMIARFGARLEDESIVALHPEE